MENLDTDGVSVFIIKWADTLMAQSKGLSQCTEGRSRLTYGVHISKTARYRPPKFLNVAFIWGSCGPPAH